MMLMIVLLMIAVSVDFDNGDCDLCRSWWWSWLYWNDDDIGGDSADQGMTILILNIPSRAGYKFFYLPEWLMWLPKLLLKICKQTIYIRQRRQGKIWGWEWDQGVFFYWLNKRPVKSHYSWISQFGTLNEPVVIITGCQKSLQLNKPV